MVERLGADKPAAPPAPKGAAAGKERSGTTLSSLAFRHVLEDIIQRKDITFSAHALSRLEQRKIKLDREDLHKITEAIDKIAAKGARAPLLLYNDIALLVSVPNRTVITAVDGTVENEQIYTHIDSAVIFK